jgi:transposase
MTNSEVPANSHKRRGAYHRWTHEQKRRIVEETLVAGASVSIVARHHDVNANQVFRWRQQYRRGELGTGGLNSLVPVGTIGAGGKLHPVVRAKPRKNTAAKAVPPVTSVHPVPMRIEIELTSGIKIRFDGNLQSPVVGRVVKLVRGLV